jgi:molecular chaperone GrpE
MFPRKKDKPKEEEQPEAAQQQPQPTEQPKQEPAAQTKTLEELKKEVEELQKQVDGLKKEKDDIFAKLQRVAADYDNYQKRSSRQTADSIAYEKDKIIKALLPILDNFEYIIANTSCGVNDEALLKGVQIIYDQLMDVLKRQGVEQIKSTGEKFDPAHHEAITQRSEQDKEDGLVLEELQKGYKLNGRLIRASRVVVNKAPIAETEQEPETKDTQ